MRIQDTAALLHRKFAMVSAAAPLSKRKTLPPGLID
jgi:hypothetical protein